jgi:two-component system, OmpR family, sensor kinase
MSLDTPGNISVRGDAPALRTLVRNLVDNAVRYTPPHGSVQVRCRATAQGALLEVSDTGPGIPARDRDRVFDRFYRRAAAQEGGTGLGLAIVKSIAERHGANIALNEAPGGGLHVSVTFPAP